ncbi:MAG: hypothetical protein FJY07_08405 [Bacteroidetes bacterium]|nr:hypothetical protein [Bacteroidota bacterium]
MDFNNIDEIKIYGFEGFNTVKSLWQNRKIIPKEMGVYLVLNPEFENPEFIFPDVGGFFKSKNPNISLEELKTKWVEDSMVVYIGKAGEQGKNATLHSRIGHYLRFGQGKKAGHWGGRYIWQLANYYDLIFCWKVTEGENPRKVETKLIDEYYQQFHKLPFANLTK